MGKTGRTMEDKDRTKIALLIGAAVLVLVFCVFFGRAVYLLFEGGHSDGVSAALPTPGRTALATPEDLLPLRLMIGKKAPDAVFSEEDRQVPLSALKTEGSRGLWLVFWASWCPDCTEQFQIIREMESLAAEWQMDLVLVDRLNPEKESREKAQAKLREMNASARWVVDENEACYKAWGMREIPSSVMLDGDGVVREYASGVISSGTCAGMLRRFALGRDSAGIGYVQSHLLNGEGGVIIGAQSGASVPSGQDVLSESQGLLMLYALEKGDRALFDRTWAYTREHQLRDGLCAWYSGDAGAAGTNALLDDLRLWSALDGARRKWGAYAADAEALLDAVASKCVNGNGELVDFAEFDSGRQASTLTLCYLDLRTLEAMARERGALEAPLAAARELLRKGRISDTFPLYFSQWDYAAGAYSQSSLNTAEALCTLWHLSRAKELPKDALDWLRSRVEAGDLAARYRVDGTAVPGYEYHSTAVYGLAALIAREEGDEALFELALRRMERKCVLDWNDGQYGSYSQSGEAPHAFDQLIPLLVNAPLGGRIEP